MRAEILCMLKRFAAALLFLSFAASMGNAQGSANNVPAKNGPATNASSANATLPKIRTVTAFVRLDRATYQAQVAEALKMLRNAKDSFTKAGYEVETLRITTQPFPEY